MIELIQNHFFFISKNNYTNIGQQFNVALYLLVYKSV